MHALQIRITVALLVCLAPALSHAAELPTITIIGGLESDSNTLVFDHEDLARFGDGGGLVDALRRLPGVQITPEGRIQLHGMGNGYTRVEMNGVPLGGLGEGAGLGSISVDRVEKVEIVRGASAIESGEAVAGIVRITTRAAKGLERLRLKGQVGSNAGQPSTTLALEWGGSSDTLDYQISARSERSRVSPWEQTRGQGISPDGSTYYTDFTRTQNTNLNSGVSMEPQLVWRAGPNDRLTLTGWISQSTSQRDTDKSYTLDASWPAWYASSTVSNGDQVLSVMPQLKWAHRSEDGNRFTLDLGSRFDDYQGDYREQRLDAAGGDVGRENQQSKSRTLGHNLGLRWDLAGDDTWGWTLGTRINAEGQYQDSTQGGKTSQSHVVRRQTAAFVQANAQFTPDLRLDAGLRTERTELDTGTPSASRRTSSDIWLPSATLIWDIAPLRSLRLNAGRTYRSPRLTDLSPGGRLTDWNVPGNPDTSGNPLLLPESATGIELGFEQRLGEDGRQGKVSVTLLQRRIEQRIQYQLNLTNGRWIVAPVNAGGALVQGLELDGHWKLARTSIALPLTLRASLGLYRSKLDDMEAPNGLPGQPPAVLNLGFDVNSSRWPLTWGGNFNMSPGYSARISSVQTQEVFSQRTLDLYAQWQLDPRTRLRLTGTRLVSDDYGNVSDLMIDTYGNLERTTSRQQAPWSIMLALEKDF